MALGWHLREGFGQAHPWGVKTILGCRRSDDWLLQQDFPTGLGAVDQGQLAVVLQQSGVTGKTCATQNDAGHASLRRVLASLSEALKCHVWVGL